MVQVVFVHGVNNRDTEEGFDKAVRTRNRRFSEIAFNGSDPEILNPYWGKFGADPAWKLACVPSFSAQSVALGVGGRSSGNEVLLAARDDFPAVVGSLSAVALETAETSRPKSLEEEEKFWAGAAAYANLKPEPAWLAQIQSDDEFYAKLREESEAMAQITEKSLSFVDELKAAGNALVGGTKSLATHPIAKAIRETYTPKIALFAGDVFRYLKAGANPAKLSGGRDEIREVILASIRVAAAAAKDKKQKLILIGHSMGGVILYDLLSDPDVVRGLSAHIKSDFSVDLLLTIGSQVSFFEEVKAFTVSDNSFSAAKNNKVPRPQSIKNWWNCFDKMDPLSFIAKPVFHDVEDFYVNTVAGVLDAHGAYFSSMMFYQRLNSRLIDAGILS
jgi:hypothetical protein